MSWLNILNKTNKDFENKTIKHSNEIDQNEYIEEPYKDYLLDYDDEFDRIYEGLINDLQFDFKMLIKDECLPFMDIHPVLNTNLNHNFYDFIKNNSNNYNEIIESVNKLNDDFFSEYENNKESYNDSIDTD